MNTAFNYFAESNVGKKRTDNQDNFCIVDHGNWIFLAVCDGMGGVNGGDLASEIAIDCLLSEITNLKSIPSSSELTSIVKKANSKIYEVGANNSFFKGLGTTLSAIVISGNGYRIAHVGDSRIFLIRNGNEIQLTVDHTWVSELKTTGLLKEDSVSSPISHMLSRSLGVSAEVEVDIIESDDILANDLFVLCTDGLHNYLNNKSICDLVKLKDPIKSSEKIVTDLIDYAINSGGADNVTVVSVRLLVDKEEVPTKSKTLSKIIGRELRKDFSQDDKTDGFPQFFDAYQTTNFKQSSVGKLNSGNLFTDSVKYFLLGGLFAFLSAVFVWIIRPNLINKTEKVENQKQANKDSRLITVLNSAYIKGLDKVEPLLERERPISLKELYEYLRIKNDEVLEVDEAIDVPVTFNTEVDLEPKNPINWANERKKLKEIKRGNLAKSVNNVSEKSSFEIENFVDSLSPSGTENYLGLKEKVNLRERTFDIDEKILQLGIEGKKEAEDYKSRLTEEVLQLDKEISKIQALIITSKTQQKKLIDLERLRLSSSESSFDMLAARLSSYDNSFEPALRRIKLLRDTQGYYLDLMGKISKTDDVFVKLTSVQQELVSAQKDLTSDIEKSLLDLQNEHAAYLSGLNWSSYLLNLERDRIQRALGYVEGFAPIPKDRVNQMYSSMVEQRRQLYREYSQYEKLASDDVEFRKTIRENYLKIKNSFGL